MVGCLSVGLCTMLEIALYMYTVETVILGSHKYSLEKVYIAELPGLEVRLPTSSESRRHISVPVVAPARVFASGCMGLYKG
jgi:hypothetical protein